jgi:hypothetical protein
LMGARSDELKEKAQDLASEQYDKGKAVAEHAYAAAASEAQAQGLTSSAGAEPPQSAEARTVGHGSEEASIVPTGEPAELPHREAGATERADGDR